MRPPVIFNGKTYYPVHEAGCAPCEHDKKDCAGFKSELRKQGIGGCRDHEQEELVWQSTKKAQIRYVTERLTS